MIKELFNTLLMAIGAITLFMFLCGTFGIYDFYLCFRPVGECIRK